MGKEAERLGWKESRRGKEKKRRRLSIADKGAVKREGTERVDAKIGFVGKSDQWRYRPQRGAPIAMGYVDAESAVRTERARVPWVGASSAPLMSRRSIRTPPIQAHAQERGILMAE